jgi:hypothetical protein
MFRTRCAAKFIRPASLLLTSISAQGAESRWMPRVMAFAVALRKFWACVLVSCLYAASAQAVSPLQVQPSQVVAPPYGTPLAVEVHRDWMFVSIRLFLGYELYEVHVFRRVLDDCSDAPCWQYHSRLTPTPPPTGIGAFGTSMEFDGRSLLVGDPGDFEGDTGRVLVFELEGEQFVLKHEFSGSGAESGFGAAISLDGNQAAVSAVDWGTLGAIYLFKRRGEQWVQTDRIFAEHSETDQLGFSIDLRGNKLIAGANEGNYAVIFERHGHAWREQRVSSPGAFSLGLGAEINGSEAFVSGHGDATVSYFVREQGEWLLTDAFTLPIDDTSFPPFSPGGPLQVLRSKRLFAGGFGGVYLFEAQGSEWSLTTHFVTPFRIGIGTEELMDVHRRWLAAIDGSLIYVFDLQSVR